MKLYKVLLYGGAATLLLSAHTWGDVIISTSGSYTGQVTRATANEVVIKQGQNEFTVPKSSIQKLEVNKPAEFDAASEALKAGKNLQEVTALKAIVERYAGLPVDWAMDAMVALSDAQIAMRDYIGAKRVLDDAIRLYPGEQARRLEVKTTRLSIAQGGQAKAVDNLRAFLAVATKRELLTDDDEYAIAEAYVLLGDCLLATNAEDALDNYLKVVTLFDLDTDRATEAQYKAGKAFEQLKNWKRAKDLYGDAVKGDPKSLFTTEAKSRLEALNKEHP
jgi:tetratricopeptide (TPR) repeat protein